MLYIFGQNTTPWGKLNERDTHYGANGTGTRTRLKSYLYVVDFKEWLGRRDSNPDTQLQRLQSYR